jgi:hypothetical protein
MSLQTMDARCKKNDWMEVLGSSIPIFICSPDELVKAGTKRCATELTCKCIAAASPAADKRGVHQVHLIVCFTIFTY